MAKINTIIVPIIRSDFIGPMLDSLNKNAGHDYYVFVIDQTLDDKAYLEYHHGVHLWIKSYRNLGFSKAHNLGITLSQTPYVTLANDDIQFLNPRWWKGIEDTFAMDQNIIAVNPMSPKEGAWGYGLRSDNVDVWTPKEGFIKDPQDPTAVIPNSPYKEYNSDEAYDWLLNQHPTWQKDTVCDAIAMWCTVFKRSGLEEIGLLEERFYPGGGEDYDMNCRAYSCAYPNPRETCDPTFHRRMVGTTKSWVWHHWGRSKDAISAIDPGNKLFESRDRWNHNEQLWGEKFDVWGHENLSDGTKKPLQRKVPVLIDDL